MADGGGSRHGSNRVADVKADALNQQWKQA